MMQVAGGLDETECLLTAAQYRRLWLDDAHTLGLVAAALAEATGWTPTDEQPLPDALQLAALASQRLAQLEQMVRLRSPQDLAHYRPRLRARQTAREYA